jgi:nucleoside-diphosphate-sugar epimerase
VILRKFLEGNAAIEEDGRRILNQIHVEDAASAVLHLALQKTKGLFNVSDDRPLSQLECYQGLAEHFRLPLPPVGEKNTSRKRAWTHKAVQNHKIRATGWHPRFPCFFDALDQLAATP